MTPAANSSRWDRFWFGVIRVLSWLQAQIYARAVGQRCWRSMDGTVTRYSDLKTGHLHSILGMMERTGDWDSPQYLALHTERVRREVVK